MVDAELLSCRASDLAAMPRSTIPDDDQLTFRQIGPSDESVQKLNGVLTVPLALHAR